MSLTREPPSHGCACVVLAPYLNHTTAGTSLAVRGRHVCVKSRTCALARELQSRARGSQSTSWGIPPNRLARFLHPACARWCSKPRACEARTRFAIARWCTPVHATSEPCPRSGPHASRARAIPYYRESWRCISQLLQRDSATKIVRMRSRLVVPQRLTRLARAVH